LEKIEQTAVAWFPKFGTMRKRSEVTADHELRRHIYHDVTKSQIIIRSKNRMLLYL
jgi:hypothetical protein